MWTEVLTWRLASTIFLKYRRMRSGEQFMIQHQNGHSFEVVLKSSGHDSLIFVP